MKRIDRGVATALAVSAWAGIILVVVPGRASVVGHVWLVLVLSIALAVAIGALLRSLPSRPSAFDGAFAPETRPRSRPSSLAGMERELALAAGTAFDVHYRLRPTVRSIASGLLLRKGIDLDRTPERAAPLVGPELWELIRPERPAPEDRAAPGMGATGIERTVDDLERLA